MLRVLVVDDSAVDRRLLVHVLEGDPEIVVIGQATNGLEAVSSTLRLNPDVITMDVRMPELDGFEATTRIMEQRPTPIVIVGASVESPENAFRALDAGALTLMRKPPGPQSSNFSSYTKELITTIKLMAEVKVVSRRRTNNGRPRRSPSKPVAIQQPIEIVALAASTGGPAAIGEILSNLPSDFPPPIVIVQHIARGFEQGLADWLDRVSTLEVRIARQGDPLRQGQALIAPQSCHLGVSPTGRVTLTNGEPIDGQMPSATHLFRSVAQSYGGRALGLILTGMGSDGREGAIELNASGGFIVAQDSESSVVFGMPGEVVAAGVAHKVLPLKEIAAFLSRVCVQVDRRRSP